MMDMMGGMGVWMLVGLVLLAVLLGAAVYLGIRAAHPRAPQPPTAQETLAHRLAAGEITAEEYHERSSALRAGGGLSRRR